MSIISKSVRFYLDSRKKWTGDKYTPRPIIVSFSYNGNTLTSSPGFRVAEKDWDYDRQRVKTGLPGAQYANQILDNLNDQLNEIYFSAKSEGIDINNKYIIERLKKKRVVVKSKTFWDYYLEYMDIQTRVIKQSTCKSVKYSFTKFKNFCQSENNLDIRFEDVTPGLLALYTDYLLKIGNTNNTIHSHIKRLKRFISHSKKMKLHNNETYNEYHVPQPLGPIKFLDVSEVKLLMEVQLDLPIEMRARDLLLFACFTGMRYSDIHALKRADIKQHRFDGIDEVYFAAHIRQVKTSQETVVPLLPEALALIKKYEGCKGDSALPQINLQSVNKALKEVGRKAGLNSMQKIERFRGTKRETSYIEKWRILTTHIGRRTFVTISASKGLPINIVASITGQNPETTMRHYMGVVTVDKFKEFTSRIKF